MFVQRFAFAFVAAIAACSVVDAFNFNTNSAKKKLIPWRDVSVAPFRYLDDLSPVAPKDSFGNPEEISTVKGNWES